MDFPRRMGVPLLLSRAQAAPVESGCWRTRKTALRANHHFLFCLAAEEEKYPTTRWLPLSPGTQFLHHSGIKNEIADKRVSNFMRQPSADIANINFYINKYAAVHITDTHAPSLPNQFHLHVPLLCFHEQQERLGIRKSIQFISAGQIFALVLFI